MSSVVLVLCACAVFAGCAGSSQAERREEFHRYVTTMKGGEIYIDRLSDPPTCWALVTPVEGYHPHLLMEVDCATHHGVVQEP